MIRHCSEKTDEELRLEESSLTSIGWQGDLLRWFAVHQRVLPWRLTRDPYRIWVSEVMLQQTRVAAAIPYYERFLERFPDFHALAAAPEAELLAYWAGLGYYYPAQNLPRDAEHYLEPE